MYIIVGARRRLASVSRVRRRREVSRIYIDEIENGFHWSVLGKVWDLFRESSAVQVFATSHRDEAVRIACERFISANDDTLRIVRLDLIDNRHEAKVYTAASALAAMDAGLEIRG